MDAEQNPSKPEDEKIYYRVQTSITAGGINDWTLADCYAIHKHPWDLQYHNDYNLCFIHF